MSEAHGATQDERRETQEASLLSPQRAFIARFREGTGTVREHFTGRVEHVVSGRAARFHSFRGLVDFIWKILADVHEETEGAL